MPAPESLLSSPVRNPFIIFLRIIDFSTQSLVTLLVSVFALQFNHALIVIAPLLTESPKRKGGLGPNEAVPSSSFLLLKQGTPLSAGPATSRGGPDAYASILSVPRSSSYLTLQTSVVPKPLLFLLLRCLFPCVYSPGSSSIPMLCYSEVCAFKSAV